MVILIKRDRRGDSIHSKKITLGIGLQRERGGGVQNVMGGVKFYAYDR